MSSAQSTDRSAAEWHCPICGKQIVLNSQFFPFCGDRCRLVDLGRWLDGTYIDRINSANPTDTETDDSFEE